ncbi:hypothetical protein [Actinoplanes xinjiangensis]|nr:hypothetical protein [Actinoplanes xinjiangensis]GIF45005.1 hypothetical protein Axi01nite_93160 [Actinoplanes xinjiangensis]
MLDLPRPLRWADRAASMPYIKGGGEAQLDSLRSLLLDARRDGGDPAVVQAADRTRPRGFLERGGRGRWRVTEAGESWLETADNAFLIGVFHSEIRFLGELLEQLSAGELTHTQLMDIARTEYDLSWGSPDQVRRRTTWLRAGGFVELRFDNYLLITGDGRDLLGRLENRPPNSLSAEPERARTVPEIPAGAPEITAFLGSLDEEALRCRRRLIGYFPGGSSGPETMRRLVAAAAPSVSRDEWVALCGERFAIGETSALQSLASFRGVGLVKRTGPDSDAVTPLAQAWLDSGTDLDVIRILHGNIRFFGEILAFLDTTGSSAELASKALEFDIPPPDLQRRIGLLLATGLIEEAGVRRYRLTPLGQAMVRELPLEPDGGPVSPPAAATPAAGDQRAVEAPSPDALETELRVAARAATDFTRLERAIASAFSVLGFQVEHLGGQGRTDVRAVAPLPGADRFVVIADAKASARGQVAPFDVVTLREHKEQHGADFVVAIGESFTDRKNIERARSEGVGLLSVEVLCTAVRLAREGVIGAADLRSLLSGTGLIDGTALQQAAGARRRTFKIVKLVLATLAAEAVGDDEVTKGSLAPSDIYIELRNQDGAPSLQEIEMVLGLLASPLIATVAGVSGKYVLTEHVTIASARMAFLGALVAGAAVTELS